MARVRKTLSSKLGITYLISTGVLASVFPRVLIDQVLCRTGKANHRRQLLPAHLRSDMRLLASNWHQTKSPENP